MEQDIKLPIGSLAFSRFIILELMANCDQSLVYATEDAIIGIAYALKFTRAPSGAHEKAGGHANIVSILQTGLWLDTSHTYMILEMCDSDLQSQIMQSHRDPYHYLNRDCYIKSIFIQILDALEYCHKQGVYHRDLKPANILVSNSGFIRLTNFDLATQSARCKDFGIGTQAYMAPECWQPQPKKTYAAAPSDVWSTGVILISLVSHRYPWTRASNTDKGYRQYWRQGQSLSAALRISPDFDPILDSIFEHEPKSRIKIPELRDMVSRCQGFIGTEVPQQAMPLSCQEGEVLFDTGDNLFRQQSTDTQTIHGYTTGALVLGNESNRHQLDVQMPRCVAMEDTYDYILYDSIFCSDCVDEARAASDTPHVWTTPAEGGDSAAFLNPTGLRMMHETTVQCI